MQFAKDEPPHRNGHPWVPTVMLAWHGNCRQFEIPNGRMFLYIIDFPRRFAKINLKPNLQAASTFVCRSGSLNRIEIR